MGKDPLLDDILHVLRLSTPTPSLRLLSSSFQHPTWLGQEEEQEKDDEEEIFTPAKCLYPPVLVQWARWVNPF